jgi:hypothetical protein
MIFTHVYTFSDAAEASKTCDKEVGGCLVFRIYFLCNLIVEIKIFKLKLRFWRVAEERHGHVHIEHGHHLHRVSLQF